MISDLFSCHLLKLFQTIPDPYVRLYNTKKSHLSSRFICFTRLLHLWLTWCLYLLSIKVMVKDWFFQYILKWYQTVPDTDDIVSKVYCTRKLWLSLIFYHPIITSLANLISLSPKHWNFGTFINDVRQYLIQMIWYQNIGHGIRVNYNNKKDCWSTSSLEATFDEINHAVFTTQKKIIS